MEVSDFFKGMLLYPSPHTARETEGLLWNLNVAIFSKKMIPV